MVTLYKIESVEIQYSKSTLNMSHTANGMSNLFHLLYEV